MIKIYNTSYQERADKILIELERKKLKSIAKRMDQYIYKQKRETYTASRSCCLGKVTASSLLVNGIFQALPPTELFCFISVKEIPSKLVY